MRKLSLPPTNRSIYFFLSILFVFNICIETIQAQSPKVEIRAIWLTTVSNLDWPYGDNKFDKDNQKTTMMAVLDSALSWNINTIFLQIRPQSDAFYESQLVPWSEYASGTRGTSPGYDPLAFAIAEAHKRGIEMHGWLNPYRYESFVGKNDGKPGDFNATHPEWMLNYDDDRIFNPGVPEVRQHLKEIVGEIINNYDIDGIHFDDYFYPYSGTGSQDQATFDTYGAGFDNIGDWRRYNINEMIANVYDTIQQIKPFVRFGISPFGIYGNGQNPAGIVGLDAYNTIFTDPIQWMSSGNVDYICPQLYWPTGGSQDFNTLLPWWAQQANANDRHVIAGHGIYRLDNNASVSRQNKLHENKLYFDNFKDTNARQMADPWTLSQVTLQIDIVRDNRDSNAFGGAFFRYQDFIRVNGLVDYLKGVSYGSPAIMPAMTWKNQSLPTPPVNIHWEEDNSGVSFITWDLEDANMRYIVYSSDTEFPDAAFFEEPANISKILYSNSYFLDETGTDGGKPYLFISAYDRFGNESAGATSFSIQAPSVASTLSFPVNLAENQTALFDFTWSSVPNAQSYILEISSSNDFTSIDFTSTVFSNTINASELALQGNHQYYWRITPSNLFGDGPVSEVFSFKTGFPNNPTLVYPLEAQDLIETLPLIKWSDVGLATAVKLQISRGGSQFETFNMVVDADLDAVSEYQLTEKLNEWTTHHLRLKLINDLGESHWVYVSFRTLITLPLAPTIYSPIQNEEQSEGTPIVAQWKKVSDATGYQIKLTSDEAAEVVIEQQDVFSANDTTITYSKLTSGIYYFNVAGKNVGGAGAWSQVKFELIPVLGIDELSIPKLLSITYEPSGDALIRLNAEKLKRYKLSFYNFLGRKIETPVPNRNTNELIFRMNKLNAIGFYIAVLESEKGIESLKFISR